MAGKLEYWITLVAEEWRTLNIIKGNRKVGIVRGDLKNPEIAEKTVRGVDVVFHYAANPEVRVSTTNPEIHFNENVVATFNLLEAMRKDDVEELLFASSSSVYGEPESIPVSEEAPTKPVSVYGASKAACKNLIHATDTSSSLI
jgi:UDP-glucose 4-epimerase